MSTPATSSPPPPLPTLDTEEFRRKLAGLADPDRATGQTEKAEVREAANRFCSILAHLFNDDALDRKTLWSRIDSALSTACAKVTDDDLDRFVSLCLEHVQADPAEAARCEALGQMLAVFDEANRPPEWRQAFLDHINTHRFAVLAHGRARWERVKAKEVDL